jgi:hypothetical protein
MSRPTGRIAAVVIACLAAGLLLAGRTRAGDTDPLKDAEARRKVAAEAAERDARDTLEQAMKLARTQPAEAIKRIEGRLQLVDLDENLSEERKAVLTALLKRGIANIQKAADAASSADANPGFHPVAPDPRDEQQKKLVNDALAKITSSKEALAEAAEIRAQKASHIANLLAQVDKASIPPDKDFSFPDNWKELSLRRSKKNMLTETEKAILKALDTRISVDFTNQRFGGVIDWFEKQMGQSIVLDKAALDEIGVNSESTTVSLQLNKVTTRTALKKVLADVGLTYIVKDETIYVTTPAKAKDFMTIRTYYIGDLLGQYDLSFGGIYSQYAAIAVVGQLVSMIENNIDKDSWEVNGKENGGTIVFDPIHMTLVVKQSAEIHYKMMQGLLP